MFRVLFRACEEVGFPLEVMSWFLESSGSFFISLFLTPIKDGHISVSYHLVLMFFFIY